MECGAGDRGVSEVVGFILVFGMLVIAFTVYQGIVVPDQNRQVEFQHNQEVHGQLQDLRNAIVTTAATGSGQAVSVTLGASYPRRAIARNLGVSGGAIQTTDAGSGGIRIENVRAIDGETDDYLDGSPHTFETKSITYTPVYTFYSSAPQTVYENSLLFNRFGAANVTLTDQVIVDGRRITLIAVNGSLQRAERDTVSISTEAISASSNRVAVTNTTDERINITVPSRLSAAKWEAVLEEEMGSDGYVRGVYDVPGEEAVNVSLKQAVTYEFRMAKVGVGGATSEESPEYLTAVGGDDESVAEGGTQKFVVEVRDRFNNPVSNVTVDASITQSAGTGEYVSPTSDTTDADGRATFTYAAPGNVDGAQEADVEVAFDDGGDAGEIVTFDVDVLDADGSGGGGGGGGASNYDVEWVISAIEAEDGVESCTGNRCTYNLSEDSNTNLPLLAETSPSLTGVFVDFSTNDSTIVDSLLPSESVTDSSGDVTTTADIDSTGVVALFASATEDSDELILEVTQAGGGGGPNLGPSTVTGSHANVGGGPERESVQFDVQNTGGSSATVDRVSVSVTSHPASGDPAEIREFLASDPWDNEISIVPDSGGSTGELDSTYSLGATATLDSNAVIPAGGSATVYLSRFQESGFFGWDDVDMRGSTLSVTFYLSGGGSTTITVNVPS